MRSLFHYTSLQTVWRYTKGHRPKVFVVLVLFGIGAAPLPLVPVFIGRLTEAIAAPERDAGLIVWCAIVVGCLGIAHSLLWHGSEFLWRRWILPLQENYETHTFATVTQNDYPYFVEKATGKISASIGVLSDRLRDLLVSIYWGYVPEVVSVVMLLGVLSSINWQSGVIFAVGLLLMPFAAGSFFKKALITEAELTDRRSTKTGSIIDSVANFVSVKSFSTERREVMTVDALQQVAIAKHRENFTWRVLFWFTTSVIVRGLMWPAIVAVNVWLFLNDKATVGDVSVAITAAFMFTNTVWELISYASQFTMKMSAMEESHTYLFGKNVVTFGQLPQTTLRAESPDTAGLAVRDVSFAYPDKPDRLVLQGVSLQIAPGEKVGIVGHSGSGKTTLVKLLLGYYEPTRGSLRTVVEGAQEFDTAQVCTYVPQDTAMFNRTVAQNIAYAGGDETSPDDVRQAAELAYAHEFIEQLPDGYDTLVGERGVKLSGGQRQRIAIARAMLNRRPVLVLDEATSALDTDSERHVQEALENMWADRTVVAIAHRLSTLHSMDRIVVMHDGRIVESGSHQELLAAKGRYAHLWTQQSGGFLVD